MKRETVYLQGDDARELVDSGCCERCLRPAREWAVPDRYGNVEVHADCDCQGNLAGFVCPDCAAGGAVLVPIPELTEKTPKARLVEFYRRLGWDLRAGAVDPCLVRLHKDDLTPLVNREMNRAGEFFRDEPSPPALVLQVGFLWAFWGPAGGGRHRGKVELHPGWLEPVAKGRRAGKRFGGNAKRPA